ncbi:MAG: hypothetical protein MJD61_00175 [Proteobacteria bacterium]|nr:hypothetical protein [Pseudomonadota bacterium]
MAPRPPEIELPTNFEQPQAGENQVYVANPKSNLVAVIDARSLAIEIVEAGDKPRVVRTFGTGDQAIVLNVASDDATVLRTEKGRTTTHTLPVVAGCNRIAVSPTGSHAVLYFDIHARRPGDPTGSFQDLTVATLAPGAEEAVNVTVGFRPLSVHFSDDGSTAFVVTEDGISELPLGSLRQASIARLIPLGPDTGAFSKDVSITNDGRYAIARREHDSTVRLVELSSGAVTSLELSEVAGALGPAPSPPVAPDAGADAASDAHVDAVQALDAELDARSDAWQPLDAGLDATDAPNSAQRRSRTPTARQPVAVTDLDLAPSGEFALAVLSDPQLLLRIPIPSGFSDPGLVRSIPLAGDIVGSVSITPDNHSALVYTTAFAVERIGLVELNPLADTVRGVRLRKPIKGVAIAPDARTALIVHTRDPADPNEPGLTPDQVIDRSFAYSLLNIASGFVKLQVTQADVGPFAVMPANSHLFVLIRNDLQHVREVQRIALESLQISTTRLGSPPLSVGAVPGTEHAFVGQEHPEGRVTFVHWNSGEAQTVTGFELNSRIRK